MRFKQLLFLFVYVCGTMIGAEQNNTIEERPLNYTGKWVSNLPDGSKYESEFLNGEAHGKNFLWDKKGNLVREGFSLHGKEHGAWIWYNKNKSIQFIRIMEIGKIKHETHYEKGEIVADGEYKNGKPWSGTFRDWHYKTKEKGYHEIREGKPWNGQFWLPCPSNTEEEPPPKHSKIFGVGMGNEYGGTVRSYDPKQNLQRRATFKEGEIVKEVFEDEVPDTKFPQKKRFDIGWPIDRNGKWLLEDAYKLNYAIEQLKLYTDHPAYADMKYKTIELARAFAAPRPPLPQAWRFLIEANALKDGMTFKQTRDLLGHPTYQKDGFARWYFNPRNFHVAPCLMAEIREDKLYNWSVGKQ